MGWCLDCWAVIRLLGDDAVCVLGFGNLFTVSAVVLCVYLGLLFSLFVVVLFLVLFI